MSDLLDFLRKRAPGTATGGSPAFDLAQRKEAYERIAQSEELGEAMQKVSGASKSKLLDFLQRHVEDRAASGEEPRPAYQEVARIASLPFHIRHTDEEREMFQRALIQAPAFEKGFRFSEKQVEALLTFDRCGGLFGPIGVGEGKTFISLMCAALAFEAGRQRSLLFVPSSVYAQLMQRDVPQARRLLTLFGLPFIWLGGEGPERRRMLASSGRRGCYVMPYSLLSSRDASTIIEMIRPDLIVADEAHKMKNLKSSAAAKRIWHYVEKADPQFVALSGTITLKSVMDYWHLLIWCLGPGSCLPLTFRLAEEWAKIIDSETTGTAERGGDAGPLLPLIQWARKQPGCPPEVGESTRGFRAAYRFRMASTPGVVQSDHASVGTSLVIEQYAPLPDVAAAGFDEVNRLMAKVVDEWLTPNGDQIDYGLHKFKWQHELTAGIWHRLTWPTPEALAARRNIPVEEAASLLERAQMHHVAENLYAKALRDFFKAEHIPGLDTPFLVGGHIARHRGTAKCAVPPLLEALWCEEKEADFPWRPERESTPVRVCDYKVRHAVRWAQEFGEGIIWVWHQEIGEWIVEALRNAGADPLHCPAGDKGNLEIVESAGRLVVASLPAHHEGKNLQFHRNSLMVQWPRSPKHIEQTIGRLHRRGQEADELVVHTNHVTEFDFMLLAASLTDALYVHQSGGGKQKAVMAGWNPLPALFPHSLLAERGLDPEGGAEMEAAMRLHFSA